MTNDEIFNLLFPPALAAQFDVVSFDPRGVRRSAPVVCDPTLVERLNRPTPKNEPEFTTLLTAQADVGKDCRHRTGPVFDHLDSTNAARDVDVLRTALGEDKLNVYALSYGTVIAQMYAERFPTRIRTMVLDGVFDHSVNSDKFAVTGALAAQESFNQFVTWCANEPECALHGTDVRAKVRALFTKAEQGELPNIDPTELTSRIVSPLTRPDLPGAREIASLTTPMATEKTQLPIYIQCADNKNQQAPTRTPKPCAARCER